MVTEKTKVVRIVVILTGGIGIIIALGILIAWIQGLPGPHHGAYEAYASLWNIRTGLWYYNDLNGHLPPATATNNGKSLSWRIEVYQALVRCGLPTDSQENVSVPIDYDSNETWNSAKNLSLQGRGIRLFEYTPHGEHFAADDYSAYYKAVTGTGTAFDPDGPQSLKQLPGDLILIVRVEKSDTHWMEPGDLNVEHLVVSKQARELLQGESGYAVLFADGSPWILSCQLPFSDLCKFFTVAGARQYDRDKILGPYRIR